MAINLNLTTDISKTTKIFKKLLKFLIVVFVIGFLGFGFYLVYQTWQEVEGRGEIVCSSCSPKINKKTIENLLTIIEDKKDYSFIFKDQPQGKINPFLQ